MSPKFASLLFASLCALTSLLAADPEKLTYFDEATMRHLTLVKGDFGNTNITVRFAGDPGSASLWQGNGQRKDKTLHFARMANEGEERGTFYTAEISESKVKIDFKPGQKEPQDVGINGEYRRTSETKYLQLAKKEFQAANERLLQTLKTATKTWQPADRAALTLWKDQWPELRQKWMLAATGIPDSNTPDKTAESWLYLAQATAQGYYFIGTMPDAKTSLDWDGEYDDLGGGHASLRLSRDGKLRLSMSSQRIHETEAGTLEATAQPNQISRNKSNQLTAELIITDPEVTDPTKQARIRLTKIGRYLRIETENTQRYAGKGWFNGIYRGAPVPEG